MLTKLKVLRTQARLTLEELAATTGLTRSFVSKLERGIAKPSIGTALRLAQALGVSVESLFARAPGSDPIVIVRRTGANAGPIPAIDEHSRLVAGTAPGLGMLAFVVHPARTRSRVNPASHHQGEELVYVLSGTVRLQLADRDERLGKGDCAHFNAAVPHNITSLSGDGAAVLIVISGPVAAAPAATRSGGKAPASRRGRGRSRRPPRAAA